MYIGLNDRVSSGVVTMQCSETTALAFIRSWKRARLSADLDGLGLPKVNILAKFGMSRDGRPPPLPDDQLSDAEVVQIIVDRMPDEIRNSFEAYHLALIRERRCNNYPHHARALILGIPKSTYFSRVNAGLKFICDWLTEMLDRIDQNKVNSGKYRNCI